MLPATIKERNVEPTFSSVGKTEMRRLQVLSLKQREGQDTDLYS